MVLNNKKVHSTLYEVATQLYIEDVLTLGKSIPKKTYLQALKILCEKTKVRKDILTFNPKGIVSIRQYDKHAIVNIINENQYKLFNEIKDNVSFYKDEELRKAVDIVCNKFLNN